MGFLMDMMGMGNANDVMDTMRPGQWGYDAQQAQYGGPNNYLTSAIDNMNYAGGQLINQGNTLYNKGLSFLDPNSEFYKKQRGFLREDIGSGVGLANQVMNQNLASRGIGSGGIRNMLTNTNTNQIGEQVRRGSNDMYKLGLGTGTQLTGQGTSALANAGNIYGNVGQLGQGIDELQGRYDFSNQAAINAQRAFEAQNRKDAFQMRYSAAAADDANAAGMWGSALGLIGDVAPLAFGVPPIPSSDKRLKKDIKNIPDALNKLLKLNGVTYNWKDEERGEDTEAGVIAQEVEEVLPEIVKTKEDGYKGVQYERLIPLLIEAIKEQQIQINKLTGENNG